MAKYRRRNTIAYSTYGSVAYAPAYEGNTARVPRREEELRRAPAPYPKRDSRSGNTSGPRYRSGRRALWPPLR